MSPAINPPALRRKMVQADNSETSNSGSVKAEGVEVPQESDEIGQITDHKSDVNINVGNIPQAHDAAKLVASLKNPSLKVKPNKDAPCLTLDSVYARIKPIGFGLFPITTGVGLVSQHTTRATLSNKYGGNLQSIFSKLSKEKAQEHGYTRFVCPTIKKNPHVPQIAGAPGLLFRPSGHDDKLINGCVEKVVVGIDAGRWEYKGEYMLKIAEALSSKEWKGLAPAVRKSWTTAILGSRSGLKMQTRISILQRRTLKREPTRQEIEEMAARVKKNHNLDDVKLPEIEVAFNEGKERIHIWTMKCVGYDEKFQRSLVEGSTAASKRGANASAGSRKRRRVTKSSSDEDSTNEDDDS